MVTPQMGNVNLINNHEIKNMTQHKDFCFWENKKKEGNTEGKIWRLWFSKVCEREEDFASIAKVKGSGNLLPQ